MIFLLYCLLSVIFTYPLVLHFTTHMQGAGDGFYFMWELWWFSHSLLTGQHPLHNNTIFYPAHDVRMVWWTAANELPAVLLEPLLGPVATYNLLIIFNIALSGYAAYLLVRYITGNSQAAFLSGFIYTYAPFHLINAFKGLLNITTWQYLPLCALAGLALVDGPTLRRALLFGLSLWMVALSDGYICAYFFIIFAPTYVVYTLSKKGWSAVPWGAAACGVSLFLSAPFLLSFISMGKVSSHAAAVGYETGVYSQHLLRYVIPYRFHPLWGKYFSWFYPDPFFEASCFTGYIPLFLGVLALFLKGERGMKIFWGAVGLCALVLSLGPYLHVWNLVTVGGRPVPLPYLILSYVPFFSFLRLPVRFSIMAILSLMVLSGLTLRRIKSIHALISLILVISLEYVLLFPYPLTKADVPPYYIQVKNNRSLGALLELPSGQNTPEYIWNMNRYMYYQTFHHKSLVSGHTPRVPNGVEDYTEETPFLRELTHPEVLIKGDIVPLDLKRLAKNGLESLREHSVGLIILHKDAHDALSAAEIRALTHVLTQIFGPPEYRDNFLESYHVPLHEPDRLVSSERSHAFYNLGTGWYSPHYKVGEPHRHASGRAEINIDVQSGTYRLRFGFIRPHVHTKTLEVSIEDKTTDIFDVSDLIPGKETFFTTSRFVAHERVKVVFRVKEGAVRPVEVESPAEAVEHPLVFPIAMDIFRVRLESR